MRVDLVSERPGSAGVRARIRRGGHRLLQALSMQVNRLVRPSASLDLGLADDFQAQLYLDLVCRWLAEAFPPGQPLEILDAGCGVGRLAVPLAQRGHRVTGIDYHEPSLQAAAERARHHGVPLQLLAGALEQRLPALRPGSFHVVLCTEVLYTCVEHEALWRQLCRLVAPGGLVVAAFMCPFNLITTLLRQGQYTQALGVARAKDGILRLGQLPAYYNWQSLEDIEERLRHAGLETLGIQPIGTFAGFGHDGMAAVLNLDTVTDPAGRAVLRELERTELADYRGVGRFLVAAGRMPAGGGSYAAPGSVT